MVKGTTGLFVNRYIHSNELAAHAPSTTGSRPCPVSGAEYCQYTQGPPTPRSSSGFPYTYQHSNLGATLHCNSTVKCLER